MKWTFDTDEIMAAAFMVSIAVFVASVIGYIIGRYKKQ